MRYDLTHSYRSRTSSVLEFCLSICFKQLLFKIIDEQIAFGEGIEDGSIFSASSNEGQRRSAIQQIHGSVNLFLAQR